jgi:hypothetical protein
MVTPPIDVPGPAEAFPPGKDTSAKTEKTTTPKKVLLRFNPE